MPMETVRLATKLVRHAPGLVPTCASPATTTNSWPQKPRRAWRTARWTTTLTMRAMSAGDVIHPVRPVWTLGLGTALSVHQVSSLTEFCQDLISGPSFFSKLATFVVVVLFFYLLKSQNVENCQSELLNMQSLLTFFMLPIDGFYCSCFLYWFINTWCQMPSDRVTQWVQNFSFSASWCVQIVI